MCSVSELTRAMAGVAVCSLKMICIDSSSHEYLCISISEFRALVLRHL